MKKIIIRSIIYVISILIALEAIVRVFHLAKDSPTRFIDEFKVEKWVPNQEGYSVTGNRRQNFSKFHINNLGFNSYREFIPTKDKVEIALVGDSFIEGFHQNYDNSIGKKIENNLNNQVEVYEYGYAGYDFADQLHLIHAYKKQFDLIDKVFIYLKYEEDLDRGEYKVNYERMRLESPLNKNLKKIKLLVYAQNIGALDPIKKTINKIVVALKNKDNNNSNNNGNKIVKENLDQIRIDNFVSLVNKYKYDKSKFILFFEGNVTSKIFIEYLKENKFKYIDISNSFNKSKKPTTLIYDQHWNNLGRDIVAQLLTNAFKK